MDRLLDELPPGALAEWQAYWQIEPSPHDRQLHVLKQLTAIVARFAGAREAEPADFDPWDEAAEVELSPDAAVAALEGMIRGNAR